MVDDFFPEERLKFEVMTHMAESLFSPRNDHKYFCQLYCEDNSGKTTFMQIMEIASPMWVKMPDVANLLVRKNRNPD